MAPTEHHLPHTSPTRETPPSPIVSSVVIGTRQLRLILRQSPLHSRICGFSESSDRRPLDPAAIVQLVVLSQDAHGGFTLPSDCNYLQNPYMLMTAAILPADPTTPCTALDRSRLARIASGQYCTSPIRLRDMDATEALFFVFSDLSVRSEGSFRLEFTLFETTNSGIINRLLSIQTPPFTVYSPKKFPGLAASTELSRHLAAQGLRLRIRKAPPASTSRSKSRESSSISARQDESDPLAAPCGSAATSSHGHSGNYGLVGASGIGPAPPFEPVSLASETTSFCSSGAHSDPVSAPLHHHKYPSPPSVVRSNSAHSSSLMGAVDPSGWTTMTGNHPIAPSSTSTSSISYHQHPTHTSFPNFP